MLKLKDIFCFLVLISSSLSEDRGNETEIKYLARMIEEGLANAFTYTLPTSADMYAPNTDKVIDYEPYDFIIIGSGATGSVIASRLSERKNLKVLVLEAGEWPDYSFLQFLSYLYPSTLSKYNWGFKSIPQTTACLGMVDQRCNSAQGKGIGGTTLINGAIYCRADPKVLDKWAELLADPSWSYENVLRLYKKSENFTHTNPWAPIDEAYHGYEGPLDVEQVLPPDELSGVFLEAHRKLGFKVADHNGPDADVASIYQLYSKNVLDASSKSVPPGLLTSINFGEMGDFEGCLSAESVDKKIQPRYCLGHLLLQSLIPMSGQNNETDKLEKYLKLRSNNSDNGVISTAIGPSWAICVPSDCSEDEINGFFMKFLTYFQCQTKEDLSPPLTNGAIATIVVFCTIISIMLLSTTYDLHCKRKNIEPQHQILIAYSLISNWEKLMKMNRNTSEYSCLNGIRFWSMMWVVVCHVLVTSISSLTNFKALLDWADTWSSMIFVSGTLSVDTFFVVGGALMAYGFMKSKHNGLSFNIFQYYLHRYLRLTPALAAMVLVSATLLKYMGSGPIWRNVNQMEENCSKYWWSTLLYIQNYSNEKNFCLAQTWYLNVDMQLYFLSPLLMFPLWSNPKVGLAMLFSLIGASLIANFFLAFENDLWGVLSSTNGQTKDFMSIFYMKTHTRLNAWLIGVALGYYLFYWKYKTLKFSLRKEAVIGIWIICFGTMLTCIFVGHELRGPEYNKWGNSLHIALASPVWACCVAWMIIACVSDYGGPINTMLSLPIYQVLNRFTVCISLILQ